MAEFAGERPPFRATPGAYFLEECKERPGRQDSDDSLGLRHRESTGDLDIPAESGRLDDRRHDDQAIENDHESRSEVRFCPVVE